MKQSLMHPLAGAFSRAALWTLMSGVLLALSGCAVGPDRRDPLEPFNRNVMQFNEGVDAVVLKPVATLYKDAVPPLARTGVSNFFGNLGDGWNFVNSVLQFKFQNAAENFMRLNVNTFFGLGGILDIASDLGIERHKEDFGQTLGRWGVPAGPFVMLPLFGPSTLRDTFALPVDRRYNLLRQVEPRDVRTGLTVLGAVDARANLLRVTAVLEEAALDKYSFVRDSHLQKRRAEIYDSGARSQDANAGSDASSPTPPAAPVAPGAAPVPAVPGQPATPPAR
ncbi:MAG: VacJ family lipoprotein [Haliea sp.]|nr:MAG: VacJ family lipoprotein [Haliea sp.]